MRIGLWIAFVLVAGLFLLCGFPLLDRDLRGSRQGKDLAFLMLAFGIVLAVLAFNLFGR